MDWRNPDFVALLRSWWDESGSFAVGTTSAVAADWMEEHGFDDAVVLDILRGRTSQRVWPSALARAAADVYPISEGTPENPVFRAAVLRLVGDARRDSGDYDSGGVIVARPAVWWRLSCSQEIRGYMDGSPFGYQSTLRWSRMAEHGLMDRFFGRDLMADGCWGEHRLAYVSHRCVLAELRVE